MKQYPIYPEIIGHRGSPLTSTGSQKYIWNVMESLDNTFVEDSIQFNYPDLPPTSLYYNLAAAVDGTHCPITNVPHTVNGRHPWFSWKKRTNGVSYQVVLDCYNEKDRSTLGSAQLVQG
eukprot:TRINITY_DN65810_c1_g1_i3.p1 TRINITY_DN65810_c1_g1~~TRINITY_DN65810_c1_g1_i3.p1  ORF type:complete len:119 (+),score=2.06 TRINITY_DN65810_c1_g1_i3:208-564(+)